MTGGRRGGVEGEILEVRDLRAFHAERAPGKHHVDRRGSDKGDEREERGRILKNKSAKHG